ncbi:MAG TPA: hypothetical protein VK788_06130 [Terriglobales bacterium]|nr:hypothetical protein [Terriglobales bacterium]
MKRFPRPRRTPSILSDSIHQQLNMYAAMASAAGVGMLALSQSAEAKIVYTPAHKLIESGQTIPLDLNHDGIADFSFQNYSNTFEGSEQGFLNVISAQAKNAVDGEAVYDRALALKAGTRVGSKARFISLHSISMVSADAAERCFGNWSNVKNRYLGLRFVIKKETHFGWARLSVSCNSANNKISAVLTGYAYETIPNKPIITGETKGPVDLSSVAQPSPAALRAPAHQPTSLGLLATGAPVLSVWRREQSESTRF